MQAGIVTEPGNRYAVAPFRAASFRDSQLKPGFAWTIISLRVECGVGRLSPRQRRAFAHRMSARRASSNAETEERATACTDERRGGIEQATRGAARRFDARNRAAAFAMLAAAMLLGPTSAKAQFSYVHRDVEPERAQTDEQVVAGPAGPLLSPHFSEQSDAPELLPRETVEWKNDAAPWLEEGTLVTPMLFDGEKAPLETSSLPQVGRIHSAREWRAWRRRRRRWSDSWMYFPISVTKFTGLLETGEPVHDQISYGEGTLSGVRAGWDVAPRLGLESRLAFARQLLHEPHRVGPQGRENFIFWDADLLIYPWGDRPWRPFLLAGLGLADVRYIDNAGIFWHQTLLTAPIGAGMQYRFNNRAAVRVDVIDNMLVRNGAGGGSHHLQHDLSITFGFEVRFARPHKPYFDYPHRRLAGLREFMPNYSEAK